MAAIRVLLAVLISGVFVAGCTSGSGHDASTTGRPRGAFPAPLTPSIPPIFRTGVQHCGNPYAVTATTTEGTIALADCPGLVGLSPTPVDTIQVGDEVTIAGVPAHAFLTTVPDNLLRAEGTTFVAIRQGVAVITIHGSVCVPKSDGSQPSACPLLKLQIG